MKLEFSQHIFEKSLMLNLMKILPEGTELFHADGQTDRPTTCIYIYIQWYLG